MNVRGPASLTKANLCSSTAKTTETPLFNKDSPLIFSTRFSDNLYFRKVDITATGSVGDIKAPNKKQCKISSSTFTKNKM